MRINSFVPDASIFESNKNEEVKSGQGFKDVFQSKMNDLNELQVNADKATEGFIKGEVEVHEMMLAAEEAKMSLQLAVQVRNKVVEAVQELSRMQL